MAEAIAVRHRLDIWFHGRGETRTEVAYYKERHNNLGEFSPEDAFVLHPYGRFCNAAKFAGEVDAFEALADVQSRYKIDEDRDLGARVLDGRGIGLALRGALPRPSGSRRIRGRGSRRRLGS